MPDSERITPSHRTLFKPVPEHVYDAMLMALRATLGERWGALELPAEAVERRFRKALEPYEHVWVAGSARGDGHGVHLDLWVDDEGLGMDDADAIAFDALNALGNQEVMVLCRACEEDGIRYRFACGTIDTGLTGSVRIVGPYARDLARLHRHGSGQAHGFHA